MRRSGRSWALVGALTACLALVSAQPASAGTANDGVAGAPRSNPLAGLPWGIYTGPIDGVYPAYQDATGQTQALLARIALRPRMTWFGSWISDDGAYATAQQYIENVTAGDPDVLTQIAIFRLDPWEYGACKRDPTAAEQASYRNWIDSFAAGIGSSRVALVLQPDLPFAFCAPNHGKVSLDLVKYSAQVFGALPHTTVYIDVGAADWPTVRQAVTLLKAAGVTYARGFALNATHYDSNPSELRYGAQVSSALAKQGVPGKHFVINTAENGVPWKYWQYRGSHLNPRTCRSRRDWPCMTLGAPPTWQVTDRSLGLPRDARQIAARLCDAFLWIGRPWLYAGANPFLEQQALALARSTPFQ